jgi:CheY-like chemotaxis protein
VTDNDGDTDRGRLAHPPRRPFPTDGKKGYAVIHVCDGGEAAEVYQREPSGLALIDVMMPLMDGYEAVRPSR